MRTIDTSQLIHHSIEEWDWLNPERKEYSPAAYISYPTSLRMFRQDMFQNAICGCLCNVPATLELAQGELRQNLRTKVLSRYHYLWFRAQTPLGNCLRDNCYEVELHHPNARFRIWIAGAFTDLGITTFQLSDWDWNKVRLKWYNGFNPGGVQALVVEIYSWHYNDWYLVDTFYHLPSLWKDSAINRVGFGSDLFYPEAVYEHWWDDTEIWRITP